MAFGSIFLRLHKGKAAERAKEPQLRPGLAPVAVSGAGLDAAMTLAAQSIQRNDEAGARVHWAIARKAPGAPVEAWTLAAESHARGEDLDRALALLREAASRFAPQPQIWCDMATLEERRGDWAAAERLWRDYVAAEDGKGWAYVALAEAIRQQGRPADAAAMLADAHRRLPDSREIAAEIARTAPSQPAETTAEAVMEAPPATQSTETVAQEAADPVSDPAAAVLPEERALALQFESLGGTGHGWEFGLFQRALGAEPLGLLRWADLSPDQLCAVLETRFEGVGEPENTEVFVPSDINPPEYWTRDRRHHMAMRSFVLASAVPLEVMSELVGKRLRFLRDKLLDDLAAGERIFVYKNTSRNLTDLELKRLYAACRRYGDNTLLAIQYESRAHPNGTVLSAGPGLLIGYIDHFSHSADGDTFLGDTSRSLLALCREAHAIWTGAHPAEAAASVTFLDTADEAERHEPPEAPVDWRATLDRFESLGGNGYGWEFGEVQRRHGANDDGLLRWADVSPDKLCEALDAEFAGVGEAAHTRIFVPEANHPPEYWTADRRYHMAMRSFVERDTEDAAAERRVLDRLVALRDALVRDLRSGAKIFVYRAARANLSSDELARLHRSCRRYGDNTLLYLRYADQDHPAGAVETLAEGLLVGSLASFTYRADGSADLDAIAHLLDVCKAALDLAAPSSAEPVEPRPETPARIHVLGNSNSLTKDSYVHSLSEAGWVTNHSVGDSVNVALLDYLGRFAAADCDVLVVETAIMDAQWLKLGRVTLADVELVARAAFAALRQSRVQRIILLLLPIESLAAQPDPDEVELLYCRLAAEFRLAVLNVYELLRRAAPPGRPHDVAGLFDDELHVGAAIHRSVGRILSRFIKEAAPGPIDYGADAVPFPVRGSLPDVSGQMAFARSSSIMRRHYVKLAGADAVARYDIPPGYRALALSVNRGQARAVLRLTGSRSRFTCDLRLADRRFEFLAGIVPIPVDLGDGPVEARVIAQGEDADGPPARSFWDVDAAMPSESVELGELTAALRTPETAAVPLRAEPVHVEALPWAAALLDRGPARTGRPGGQ